MTFAAKQTTSTAMKHTPVAKDSRAFSQSQWPEWKPSRPVSTEVSATSALSATMPAPMGSMEESASRNSTLSNLRIMPETPP
ncbi:MAG: hypothetical protein ACLUMK_13215 [Christensenellales bacterium]